jgi:hypothetical protein
MKQILITFSLAVFLFACSTKKEKVVFEKRVMTVSNPTDGWGGDVKLSISSILPTDTGKVISVLATFNGKDVGFNIIIPTENKKSDSGFGSGLILASTGTTSDNFLTALNEIYKSKKTDVKFNKNISLNFVDLDAMASKLTGASNSDSEQKKYKLFFENDKENAELYLNIDEKGGWVELNEKDSEYRIAIMNFLSQSK